jgi:ATPase
MSNTADVLLLVRPDYVIFDELRKKEDYSVFGDMRLSGLGMVGVVPASSIRDAVQRFSDRVDLSVLSQVVSTLLFVKEGKIVKVYDVEFTIKAPQGMAGDVYVRPVITVREQETGQLVLDIFRYDGETIVMPVTGATPGPGRVPQVQQIGQPVHAAQPLRPAAVPAHEPAKKEGEERPGWKLAEKDIQREIGRYTEGFVDVQMLSDTKAVVYIDDKDVPAAIGKGGKNVSAIVNKIGIGIDIKPRSDLDRQQQQAAVARPAEEEINLGGGIKIQTDKRQLTIVAPEHTGKIVDVFAGKEYLFTATVNETGEIHLAKNSSIAQEMLRRFQNSEVIKLRPV